MAGRRAGLDGERSGLWFEFHRLAAELAPGWVLIENVPGLLSSNGGADLATILGGLEELGYQWAYRTLDAQYFGVAQRRRRVFIIGGRGGRSPGQVLFEPESVSGNPAPSREPGQAVAPTLAARTRAGGGLGTDHDLDGGLIPEVAPALMGRSYKSPNVEGGEDVVIPNKAGVRRLTPTEAEKLQGFPDGWTEGVSDTQRYRQLGNAVCVPVAEWIGRKLLLT